MFSVCTLELPLINGVNDMYQLPASLQCFQIISLSILQSVYQRGRQTHNSTDMTLWDGTWVVQTAHTCVF